MQYPVHYRAEKPTQYSRVQLALRVVVFLVIGLIGLSIGTVVAVAYIGLPAFAAMRLGSDPETRASYLDKDAPRLLRVLTWLAAILAWLGLVTDRVPQRDPEQLVRIELEPDPSRSGAPTEGSALWRLITGIPSALVLVLLYVVGVFVWLWSALRILVEERVGDVAHRYLVGVQRWTMRLLAYQASLVEAYPPFAFEDTPPQSVETAA